MPVMKQFRIGSATYDTVGEASVTQVQTSGTKIATVTIDGTATDLYAPEGGSGPEPSSTTPAMDGTAAVGTATTYARADHVHPTDTSRQATLVSGTNIKTVNGNSLLGSGDLTVDTSVSMEDTAVDAAVDAATYLTGDSTITITNNSPSYITINKTTVKPYEPFVVTCGSSDGTVSFSATVYSPSSVLVPQPITSFSVLADAETVLLAGAGNTTVTFTPNSGGGGSND